MESIIAGCNRRLFLSIAAFITGCGLDAVQVYETKHTFKLKHFLVVNEARS